jgi:hypothetical protein
MEWFEIVRVFPLEVSCTGGTPVPPASVETEQVTLTYLM